MSAPRRPLDGIRVLDLSRFVSGPFCAMLLGDLGADVIKVERPGTGDGTRRWGAGSTGPNNPYFMAVNRNKRSITVNLRTLAGRALIDRLVAVVDVVVENFIPGTLDGLGIGYEHLRGINPRLVYCEISGYGATGPYRDRPAFDFTMQAESGLMSLIGEPEDVGWKVGVPILDITTALAANSAIGAALYDRERTGEGRLVSVAMLDTAIAAMANVASDYLVVGRPPRRWGNEHANLVPYQVYDASDGPFAIGVATEEEWRRFCAIVERADLVADGRFTANPDRLTNREALNEILHPILKRRPRAEWLTALRRDEIPCAAINDLPTVFEDEHVIATGIVEEVAHPMFGTVRMVRSPLRLDGATLPARRHPPTLGEHTDEILRELLGCDDAEREALRAAEAV